MAETIGLTVPVTRPSSTTMRIDRIVLDIENRTVSIAWLDNAGQHGGVTYSATTTPTGQTILNNLNTVDLRANSLVRRVLSRLQTDGYLPAGTISGSPD